MLKNMAKSIGNTLEKTISGVGELASKGISKAGLEQTADFVGQTTGMIGKASGASVQLSGQIVEGLLKTAKGQLQQDEFGRDEGVTDLKDAGTCIVKGVGRTLKVGAINAYETGAGLKNKDYNRAKQGVLNLSKLGIVAVTAVSVIDLVSAPDAAEASAIQAINADLAGGVHPVTGVPFETVTIEFQGIIIQDVFPVFDSSFTAQLPEGSYLENDAAHFRLANGQLADAIVANPGLATDLGLSITDLQQLQMYQTPEGYTWHHHEQPGELQLVDTQVHEATAHTGGRLIWGGGSTFR